MKNDAPIADITATPIPNATQAHERLARLAGPQVLADQRDRRRRERHPELIARAPPRYAPPVRRGGVASALMMLTEPQVADRRGRLSNAAGTLMRSSRARRLGTDAQGELETQPGPPASEERAPPTRPAPD